eukprot:GFUD01104451.1.p1 GENE.GFUD01104451.1~~GFUD01104451.1.p1  ORF type:complete len:540 (-),score=97.41 GFUD01104451.1:263-1882(-)
MNKMDQCRGALLMAESRYIQLSYTGGLLYRETAIPSGQFCLSTTTSGREVAVVCDTCLTGVCVQQCCPPGQVRREDQDWRPPRCPSTQDLQTPIICAPTKHKLDNLTFTHSGKTFPLMDNTQYNGHFKCPRTDPNREDNLMSTRDYYEKYFLTEEGHLEASYPGDEEDDERVVHTYDKNQFCLVYLQMNDIEEDVEISFRHCSKELQYMDGEEFTFIFYPTAMLISSLFLLLTLIAYLVDPELHRPLFGKITIGFVFNNLIAYLCLSGNYLSRHANGLLLPNSLGCITVGYLTQYTFTSFMFWINAMAANIFLKFSSTLSSTSDNDRAKYILYTLYAQGMPLLLCIFTALMDEFGSCDWILPNMGKAHCFLGAPWGASLSLGTSFGQWETFFSTPEFLYFHSVLIALQVANVLFFLRTVYYLVEHWRNAAGIIKIDNSGNFLIVIKLFFIMGIPWIGDFFSNLVTHKNGPDNSFQFRCALDLLNLFTGVLVFLVLVCKKKTIMRLGIRISKNTSRRSSTYNTRTSVMRDRDSKDVLLEN